MTLICIIGIFTLSGCKSGGEKKLDEKSEIVSVSLTLNDGYTTELNKDDCEFIKEQILSLGEFVDDSKILVAKKWDYEYKFRKGGKTLCAFYFKNNTLGFMIIFGKDERSKLEEIRNELSSDVLETYDNAQTYHDGKWVMFDITDNSILEDLKKLLLIKRKPNRK